MPRQTETRNVTAEVWTAAMQAALDADGPFIFRHARSLTTSTGRWC